MKLPPIKSFLPLLALFAVSCVSLAPPAPPQQSGPPPNADFISHWDGDALTGEPSVVINLTQQRAYLYKGSDLAGVSLISSGREGLDTITGNFKIIQKDKEHRSTLYGDYVDANGQVIQANVDTSKDPPPPGSRYVGTPMPNFMRIVGGTGMHTGFLPGYPDSHGCIRMPNFMAEAFFRTVKVGTPVRIVR